mgnify:CR=1 FL=1
MPICPWMRVHNKRKYAIICKSVIRTSTSNEHIKNKGRFFNLPLFSLMIEHVCCDRRYVSKCYIGFILISLNIM